MSVFPEEAIMKLLADDSTGVAALVGTQIYHMYAPKNIDPPYITVQRISGVHANHLLGPSGILESSIQVDGWSDDALEVKDLGEKIRLALSGYRGTVSPASGSITIKKLILESDNDGFIGPEPGADIGIRRVSLDFAVGHAEAVPTFST